ncbi:hypothetical protein ACRS8P_27595 [Burkholderia cenocepacia]|uniref:hypothetical protein n=1 Tax=Burkholderia TaxID=32008 RepID=UPI00158CFC76|nr:MULTISPECIES: hypothetical protein [Burkholderia]MBR8042148.1 hypothetical protein [Burkholderia cenocepacia]MBR8082630.1 hypothetical protein [Burkholderia vietnamiensis]
MKHHVLPVAAATVLCGLLAACANGGPDVNGFVQKANSAVENAISSVTGGGGGSGGDVTNAAGPVYTPIAGGNSLQGLFGGQNQQLANYGKIAYPRVALEYLSYGASQPCWKVRATIWANPKRSHDETFQVCDVPIAVRDAVGQVGQLNPQAIVDKIDQTRAPINVPNTGDERTRGPLPPLRAMSVPLTNTGPMFQANPLQVRLDAINARIAYVAKYVPLGDTGAMSVVSSAFYDYRVWIWRFDPAGNRG